MNLVGLSQNPSREVVFEQMENEILESVLTGEMPGETHENNIPVETRNRFYQYRAVILLLVLLIPALIAAYQLISNQLSNEWVHAVQPHLPQLDSVITF